MVSKPFISVIMTAYNEEKFIKRAVDSILNQTYSNFEFIIINDGSTDKTKEILDQIEDPRVKVYHQTRQGRVRSLNNAIRLTTGKYIANTDADDYSLPERLEKQVEFLERNPTVGVLGTAYVWNNHVRKEKCIRINPLSDREIRKSMAKYIPICQGSLMVRKEIFDKAGYYNEDLKDIEDLELWLRVGKYFEFANLPEPLYVYDFRSETSYFYNNFALKNRNKQLAKLSLQAIKEFNLPKSFYIFPILRLTYPYIPDSFKWFARKLVGVKDEKEDISIY